MKVKIMNVKTVRGSTLNPNWKSDMQVVQTDKGEYIDNVPYGGYQEGHDWEDEVGYFVDVEINNSRGYKWLNFIKRTPKPKKKKVKKSAQKIQTMNVTIKNVRIIKGQTLDKSWHADMQIITTNAGEFIDNVRYGGYKEGYDWEKEVGNRVKLQINDSKGHLWATFIERQIQPKSSFTSSYNNTQNILHNDKPKQNQYSKVQKQQGLQKKQEWNNYMWIGIGIAIIFVVLFR